MARTKSLNTTTAIVMTASLILFGSVRLVTTDVPEMYSLPQIEFKQAPTLENRLGKPSVVVVSNNGKRECRIWVIDNIQTEKHCRVRYKF